MSRKRTLLFLALLSALAFFLVIFVYSGTVWLGARSPQPPEPDLAGVDPDVVEAIAAAQDKVRQQPNNGPAWGLLGMVFFAHDFHDEAERSFVQAERLDSADGR